ncbi:MAG: hypothetical protein ACTSRE_13925 [Promethearchaeota archaeon]
MSRKKTHSKKRKAKKRKLYSYLFHISTQPRKFLQPYRTSYCFDPVEDRTRALLFLCPRHEIKTWIDWVMGKRRNGHDYKSLLQGGYVTLYIHVVRVYTPDLIIPTPRYGKEYVVKDRLRPRAIVPIRVSYIKKIDLGRLNSTLKRLNELKVKV